MDNLRVGVILDSKYNPFDGGGYSYYERLISGIDSFNFDGSIEISFVSFHESSVKSFKKPVIDASPSKLSLNNWRLRLLYKCNTLFVRYFKGVRLVDSLSDKITRRILKEADEHFANHRLDLLYFLTQEDVTFNYPYIITHWDLGHKSMFAFPEVTMSGEYEFRDKYHRSVLQRAFAIFTESITGKEELVFYERINPARILVMPMFAGGVVDITLPQDKQSIILKSHGVSTGAFFFYPAQFWCHKNHYNLVKAFAKVLQSFPDFKLVLTGADKGNLGYIQEKIRELQIEQSVVFAGFVNSDELYTFYKNSIALVMPTFLGPTNMPLLEALELGCRILCSDLKGHYELLGDNALYFDAHDPEDIYLKMVSIITTEFNRSSYSTTLPKALEALNSNLLSLLPFRKTFGSLTR